MSENAGEATVCLGGGLVQPTRSRGWLAVAAVVGLASCSSHGSRAGVGGGISPTKGIDGGQSGAASSSGGSGGSGGGSSETTKRCPAVDGKLAYGPIGDPQPLPATADASAACASCSAVLDAFGFRTAAGYGFVWNAGYDSNAPGPNLYSSSVDSDFKAGEPPALLAENTTYDLDVVPAPGGFVAATCSSKSEPGWLRLNQDLGGASGSSMVAPDVPCEYRAPGILWTGEGYLTSFADSRGLVVALLDERSNVVNEQIVSALSEAGKARFSKNGDRVLFVFDQDSRKQAWYGVLDLRGTLLGAVQPIGDAGSSPLDFVIVANRDGWLVASHVLGKYGAQLTGISGDGLVWREQRILEQGYAGFHAFTPSAFGGSLLVGSLDESGQFGVAYQMLALIDDAGDVVYSEVTKADPTQPRPIAVVRDPLKDLVVELLPEGSGRLLTVQEYGCLD